MQVALKEVVFCIMLTETGSQVRTKQSGTLRPAPGPPHTPLYMCREKLRGPQPQQREAP